MPIDFGTVESFFIATFSAEPPDLTNTLRSTEDMIERLVCPPPPSDNALNEEAISSLIVPAPEWSKSISSKEAQIYFLRLQLCLNTRVDPHEFIEPTLFTRSRSKRQDRAGVVKKIWPRVAFFVGSDGVEIFCIFSYAKLIVPWLHPVETFSRAESTWHGGILLKASSLIIRRDRHDVSDLSRPQLAASLQNTF